MATLESSRCRFCSRISRYSGAYKRHLAQGHPVARQKTSATSRRDGARPWTPGSDYESDYENLEEVTGSPAYEPRRIEIFEPTLPAIHQLPESILEIYPGARQAIRHAPEIAEEGTKLLQDPWYPFSGAFEFKQARWMVESCLAKSSIDWYFCEGLCTSPEVAFTSGWTLFQQLDKMYPELGPDS